MLPTLAASLVMLAPQQNVLVENKLERDAAAAKRAAMKPERLGGWNDGFKVLFKGKIMGEMTVPDEDGRMMQSIMVKSANGGVTRVQLAPKEWVEAAALRFYENTPIWVAGSKSWDGYAWVVHAQRVNMEGVRPSFRREDGTPFWEPKK